MTAAPISSSVAGEAFSRLPAGSDPAAPRHHDWNGGRGKTDDGDLDGDFTATCPAHWVSPFTVAIGCFALFLFAFLAAVYLTVEAKDPELKEDFGGALLAGGAVFLAAGGAARPQGPVRRAAHVGRSHSFALGPGLPGDRDQRGDRAVRFGYEEISARQGGRGRADLDSLRGRWPSTRTSFHPT